MTDTRENDAQTAMLRQQLTLIGATNEQRAVAIAQMEAERHVADLHNTGKPEGDAFIQSAKDRAQAQAQLQTETDNFNASLSYQADIWILLIIIVATLFVLWWF